MTMTRSLWLVMAISTMSIMMAVPALAQQRPLTTEDPETVGVNRVLVEGGMEFDTSQIYPAYGLTGSTTHGPSFGVSVGVGPNAELQADGGILQRLHVTQQRPAPLSSTLTFSGDSTSSLEDMIVAAKLRIVPESARRAGYGFRFGTKLPLADHTQGMGLGTTDFFASLLVAKTVESVRTVGNVSFLLLGDPQAAQDPAKALGFGLSVARAVTNEFEAVGELNGHFSPFGSRVSPALDSRGVLRLAGRYTHQLLRFDFGVLVGITSRDPGFGVSAGATYVIGK
jgi:hypothetical protein